MHREPGQFLQRVEHLALAADQLIQVLAAVDAHHRAAALDVQIDVAVEVQQVEQLFQIVAGDLSLGDQPLLRIALGLEVALSRRRVLYGARGVIPVRGDQLRRSLGQ